jgi:excinuclease ABC subunit C
MLEKKGIGKATLKKLLNHFGSFEAIRTADYADLCAVVSPKIARTIHENL